MAFKDALLSKCDFFKNYFLFYAPYQRVFVNKLGQGEANAIDINVHIK